MRPIRIATVFIAGLLVGAIAVGGAFAAKYVTGGDTEVSGIKLTGAGLPDLGSAGTYGITQMPAAIRGYHDSGKYAADLATVGNNAERSLNNQLKRLAKSPGPGKYSQCNKRGKKCKQVRPAIVFDIDETALSSYANLDAADFSSSGLVPGAASGGLPAIEPSRDLYDLAVSKGVTPFFITGRPSALATVADTNLKEAGYDDGFTLITKAPDAGHTIEYKSGERAQIEQQDGYKILINIGDQDSDLAGGHAVRAFKLPNPMYFIP